MTLAHRGAGTRRAPSPHHGILSEHHDMTDTDKPQHRAYHQPGPDRVSLREPDGSDDDAGVFRVRLPIATTGEVRNEGDDPLSEEEIEGMRQQIDERPIGVFVDHGANPDIAGSRYSALEKAGEWEDPETQARDDGETELVATARMMDPETLPAETGMIREALSRLKAQVERGMSLSSSIGWRTDDTYPGGVDLMETSIVGIGADPRTTSQSAGPAAVMARAAMAARGDDVDPETLLSEFRAAVMGPDNERHLSGQQAEIADRLVGAYRDEQGNGSVENFEEWLWSVAYYQFDENEFHAAMTALQEFFRSTTPLDEPVDTQFVPFLADRQGESDEDDDVDDRETDMTDDIDSADDESANDTREEDGISAAEFREQMLEMQRAQSETLNALAESLREDDEDDDEDDESENESDEGDDDDEDDDEDERTVTIDGEEMTADEAVRTLSESLDDATPADPTADRDADADADDDVEQRAANPKNLL